MVQITQASVARNKALRGLAVSVILREGETVESDFFEIKDALLDWERTHGKTAASISMEYRTPDSSRQQIENFWLAKIESDPLIRRVFVSVGEVGLCLITEDGRNIRQIGFELGSR
jgi:hypothetical protein